MAEAPTGQASPRQRRLPKHAPDSPQGRTPSPAVFTIVSANYISMAATLMQSVRRHHPDVARYIILADAYNSFDGMDLAAELITCDQLGIDLLGNMKLWYTVMEFNTAVKPFTFRALFQRYGYTDAVYLDPDIQLYGPIDDVFTALQDHSLVLTPHMTKPLQDGKEPSDLSIMKAGVYNLGFAAVKNDADGNGLVDWWCDRLFAHCRVDIAGNMFTDQRWMDLSPVLVERPFLLRHPGYNAAYWNIAHRVVERAGDGSWTVNGLPLKFFHFSGIKVNDPTVFSKHQNRFTIDDLGQIAELCDEYRTAVAANAWEKTSRIPYAYGKFRDGRPIEDGMRRWVMQAIDSGRLPKDKPIRINAAFFDAADEQVFADGQHLTRYAYQLWQDRPDLRRAFDLQTTNGFASYVSWFCGGQAEQEGSSPRSIQAARALQEFGKPADAYEPREAVPPPWPAMATSHWDGPARDVHDWLLGEVAVAADGGTVALPRQMAFAWERRTDLQRHFPLLSLADYDKFMLWTLTNGLQEGAVLPALFSDAFWRSLDSADGPQAGYDGMPVTRGLLLTARCGYLRDNFQSWTGFPGEFRGRLEHAFWFVFVAAREFGWDPAMTASVRAYLDGPSEYGIGSYRFSRGMMVPWDTREDVRQTFSLQSEAGAWLYLTWLAVQGRAEYGVELADLCPGLDRFLFTLSPRYAGLLRLDEFAYYQRDDLRAAFDLATPEGRAGLTGWMTAEQDGYLAAIGLRVRTTAVKPPLPVHAHVALTGDWDTQNGVGEDLRSSVAALDAAGFTDYVIVNLDAKTVLTAERVVLPPGTPVRVAWNIVHRNADTAVADWVALAKLAVEAQRVVGHWHWELERLPSYAAYAYSFYDEIWASSQFALDAFAADQRRPVRLLNGAVTTPSPSHLVSRQTLGLDPDATVFLFMFDFGSYATRKNPHAVIQAFELAFPMGDEPVQLMIKTQNAKWRPDLMAELAALSDDPRIILKDARVSRDALISLMMEADAFVSLHRSEGYGRAPAEAMLLGRPVILTGYSGTNDFADAGCACVVDYTLVPVQPNEYPGVERQRWADADVGQAAAYMRWVHEQPEAALAMAQRGRQRVLELLDPAKVGAAMVAMMPPLEP